MCNSSNESSFAKLWLKVVLEPYVKNLYLTPFGSSDSSESGSYENVLWNYELNDGYLCDTSNGSLFGTDWKFDYKNKMAKIIFIAKKSLFVPIRAFNRQFLR